MPPRPAAVRSSLADAAPDVYWTDRPERPDPRPALTGSGHRADLVVVGGGFTGLWAAVQAKEDDPSRDVVLLERGRLGVAASGRNGGFVSPSLTHGLAQGLACWPDEIETLERLGTQNMADLADSLTRHGIEADFHVPGEITMALTARQVPTVREAFELHRDHGVPVSLLDAGAARARVDSPRYLGGFVDPTVGLVDPARLVWGLAAAAERLGVRLQEDTSVTGLEREDGAVVVRTEWGSVRTDRVVLGTGAFRGLLRRLALWTLPVYDHVLMTEPLSAAQLAAVGWDGREGLTDAGNQFHYYRRTLDDRVLFGGYDANYHFPGRIDPRLEQSDSHELLARHFLEIFPQL
ncbi:MAG TPA: FAD-dependent oxidoreductase, partial [Ornithinibacter sp.]|nr:FAD-dependent oxidoreductase [Ornithinibacter sp.]